MKSRELGDLGLRLIGIYVVVQVFALLPTMAPLAQALVTMDLAGRLGIISLGLFPLTSPAGRALGSR